MWLYNLEGKPRWWPEARAKSQPKQSLSLFFCYLFGSTTTQEYWASQSFWASLLHNWCTKKRKPNIPDFVFFVFVPPLNTLFIFTAVWWH